MVPTYPGGIVPTSREFHRAGGAGRIYMILIYPDHPWPRPWPRPGFSLCGIHHVLSRQGRPGFSLCGMLQLLSRPWPRPGCEAG